jgi:hypothetical protein
MSDIKQDNAAVGLMGCSQALEDKSFFGRWGGSECPFSVLMLYRVSLLSGP